MPLASGSLGLHNRAPMPSVPRKRWYSPVKHSLPCRHWPMQPSPSHTAVRGIAPICSKQRSMPERTSWAARVGTIHAAMKREYPLTEVTTQSLSIWSKPSGIEVAGCHRSNCTSSPGA